ncbi:MAG: hypothetical protein ABW142_09150 [Thermoleophilaceae bacterium]
MTVIGTHIAAVLTAGAVAAGAVFGAEASTGEDAGQPTALVIDSTLARHGSELVDPRLRDADAAIRLPRTAEEARTNVRYFDALDYRVYVAGARSAAAAEQTGVDATEVHGLDGAVAAAR